MNLGELSEDVERVSALYARIYGFDRDPTWMLLKLHEEVGELTQVFLARAGQARDKGRTHAELDSALGDELADVLAHLLLVARHCDVDLSAAVERKWLAWLKEGALPPMPDDA